MLNVYNNKKWSDWGTGKGKVQIKEWEGDESEGGRRGEKTSKDVWQSYWIIVLTIYLKRNLLYT